MAWVTQAADIAVHTAITHQIYPCCFCSSSPFIRSLDYTQKALQWQKHLQHNTYARAAGTVETRPSLPARCATKAAQGAEQHTRGTWSGRQDTKHKTAMPAAAAAAVAPSWLTPALTTRQMW